MKSNWLLLIPIVILALSFGILYPNFSERTLELVVRPDVLLDSKEKQDEVAGRFQSLWKTEYSKNADWRISPDPSLGIPNRDLEGKTRFLVTGRFITSAKINQISQENEALFLESKSKILPNWFEEKFRSGKPLGIKLGLDLQGGMRVSLKGDFESYKKKLEDIYSKELSDLRASISRVGASDAEKKKSQNRLEEIQSQFELNPSRKLIELEKAKLIIDNRLTNQNLTEPQVRIQKEQESIEVSLPGVSNSGQILEILQNTETVEYRLEEPGADPESRDTTQPKKVFAQKILSEQNELQAQGKNEELDIIKYQKIIKDKLGKRVSDDFLAKLEEKYGIPKDKYKLFALWARGNNPKSQFLPRSFVVLEKSIALSGNDLTNARPYYNENSSSWKVEITFTPAASEKFFELTSANRGRNLAIVWGDKVVSNPTIGDPIAGGRAEISGSFTQDQAVQLSNVISEGVLPIPLSVLEMRFIGPTLGIESIEVGFKSVAIGFVLVILYMIFYYRLAGVVADFALMVNLVVLFALLSLMDFTLTLPGFAGVILTVGMAVDANVIIYERIREELAHGKTLALSVTRGFENAFWTIMDSNITTLIAGILMIRLGNGPIKGFAITLCWGIITSLFTSLFLSRLLMEFLTGTLKLQKLSLGFGKPFSLEGKK